MNVRAAHGVLPSRNAGPHPRCESRAGEVDEDFDVARSPGEAVDLAQRRPFDLLPVEAQGLSEGGVDVLDLEVVVELDDLLLEPGDGAELDLGRSPVRRLARSRFSSASFQP